MLYIVNTILDLTLHDLILCPAPSPPLAFAVSTITNSSTTLTTSWQVPDSPNGLLQNYTVTCVATEMLVGEGLLVVGASITEVVVTGLRPFTNYTCNVVASTRAGESPPSNSAVAATDESSKHLYLYIN